MFNEETGHTPQSGLWSSSEMAERWQQDVERRRLDMAEATQRMLEAAELKPGDRVLFYHSGTGKCIVGIAEVVKAAYPDPTANDPQWVAVDLKPLKPLKKPVPLASIRYHADLSDLPLIRQSQLSVMALTKEEFETIVAMGDGKKRR